MLNDRLNLWAFVATLAAIVALALIGGFLDEKHSKSIAYAITGLIGVVGSFRPRTESREGGK